MRLLSALLLLTSCATARGPLVAAWGDAGDALGELVPGMRRYGPIESVLASGCMVYLVEAGDGVVLVDTGGDEAATALRAQLRGRKVKAVLLTHAHPDHAAAAHVFDAPVYVGAADAEVLKGRRSLRALLPAFVARTFGLPPPPRDVRPVFDGDVIDVDGARFGAVLLPGHTPGSTAWLHERTLFCGDALWSADGEAFVVSTIAVSDDASAALRVLDRLRMVSFDAVADGHYGFTTSPHAKIDRLRRAPAP